MKELLQRLSERMPERWLLVFRAHGDGIGGSDWLLSGPDDFLHTIRPQCGDIGLAPLTALLKQSLGDDFMPNRRTSGDGGVVWEVVFQDRADTEFEAVTNAYLALRENS